jgi:hypothetical protein
MIRGRLLALLMLGVIIYAALMIVETARAQESQQAYTLADPVRPDGYGLATLGGRYSISLGDACGDSGVAQNMNVTIEPVPGFSGIAIIAPADGSGGPCPIRFERQESDVTCFTIDGVCDVTAELP